MSSEPAISKQPLGLTGPDLSQIPKYTLSDVPSKEQLGDASAHEFLHLMCNLDTAKLGKLLPSLVLGNLRVPLSILENPIPGNRKIVESYALTLAQRFEQRGIQDIDYPIVAIASPSWVEGEYGTGELMKNIIWSRSYGVLDLNLIKEKNLTLSLLHGQHRYTAALLYAKKHGLPEPTWGCIVYFPSVALVHPSNLVAIMQGDNKDNFRLSISEVDKTVHLPHMVSEIYSTPNHPNRDSAVRHLIGLTDIGASDPFAKLLRSPAVTSCLGDLLNLSQTWQTNWVKMSGNLISVYHYGTIQCILNTIIKQLQVMFKGYPEEEKEFHTLHTLLDEKSNSEQFKKGSGNGKKLKGEVRKLCSHGHIQDWEKIGKIVPKLVSQGLVERLKVVAVDPDNMFPNHVVASPLVLLEKLGHVSDLISSLNCSYDRIGCFLTEIDSSTRTSLPWRRGKSKEPFPMSVRETLDHYLHPSFDLRLEREGRAVNDQGRLEIMSELFVFFSKNFKELDLDWVEILLPALKESAPGSNSGPNFFSNPNSNEPGVFKAILSVIENTFLSQSTVWFDALLLIGFECGDELPVKSLTKVVWEANDPGHLPNAHPAELEAEKRQKAEEEARIEEAEESQKLLQLQRDKLVADAKKLDAAQEKASGISLAPTSSEEYSVDLSAKFEAQKRLDLLKAEQDRITKEMELAESEVQKQSLAAMDRRGEALDRSTMERSAAQDAREQKRRQYLEKKEALEKELKEVEDDVEEADANIHRLKTREPSSMPSRTVQDIREEQKKKSVPKPGSSLLLNKEVIEISDDDEAPATVYSALELINQSMTPAFYAALGKQGPQFNEVLEISLHLTPVQLSKFIAYGKSLASQDASDSGKRRHSAGGPGEAGPSKKSRSAQNKLDSDEEVDEAGEPELEDDAEAENNRKKERMKRNKDTADRNLRSSKAPLGKRRVKAVSNIVVDSDSDVEMN